MSAAWNKAHPEKTREATRKWNAKQDPFVMTMYRMLVSLSRPGEQRRKNVAYYAANREKELARGKAWQKKNGHVVNASARRRRKANDKARVADNLKYETSINFRIAKLVRNRVVQALKRGYKAEATAKLVGCSFDDLRIYLETKFEVGMSWENHGRGDDGKWHIDHIIPLALFDLSRPEHQKRAFHFSNLQPLWEPDNLRKSKTVATPQFQLI